MDVRKISDLNIMPGLSTRQAKEPTSQGNVDTWNSAVAASDQRGRSTQGNTDKYRWYSSHNGLAWHKRDNSPHVYASMEHTSYMFKTIIYRLVDHEEVNRMYLSDIATSQEFDDDVIKSSQGNHPPENGEEREWNRQPGTRFEDFALKSSDPDDVSSP